MKQLSKLLPYLTSSCILLLLILLAANCVDIYVSPDTGSGCFSYQDSADRLKGLLPVVICCALLILCTWATGPQRKLAQPAKSTVCKHREDCSRAQISELPMHIIRIALLLTAVVFIICGIFNGGLYDVFVKAINICTECIGLG